MASFRRYRSPISSTDEFLVINTTDVIFFKGFVRSKQFKQKFTYYTHGVTQCFFCDGTRRYGVPAPFFAKDMFFFRFLMCTDRTIHVRLAAL